MICQTHVWAEMSCNVAVVAVVAVQCVRLSRFHMFSQHVLGWTQILIFEATCMSLAIAEYEVDGIAMYRHVQIRSGDQMV